jgi:hypothetical protein
MRAGGPGVPLGLTVIPIVGPWPLDVAAPVMSLNGLYT